MKRNVSKAQFPRLREIRERELGWEVSELAAKLAGRPSAASLYRLENGLGIRAASARKVFDLINKELGGKLDPQRELNFGK